MNNLLVERHSCRYQNFRSSREIIPGAVKSCSIAIACLGLVTLGQAAQASTLSFSSTFGSFGSGNGEFQYPFDVAVNPDSGNVYVADTDNHRIQEFNSQGGFVSTFGSRGTGNGQFRSPFGVAVNPDFGNVYVADIDNNHIQVLSSTPVPFEFSPGLGIMALGACGAIAQLKSKMQKLKTCIPH